jgi:hypothetical protein
MLQVARSVLLVLWTAGCSQQAVSPSASGGAADSPSSAATSTDVNSPGDAGVVAVVMGRPVKRSDCLSPSQGIGSVEVGIYTLVLQLLLDDFAKAQDVKLTQEEVDAFYRTMRANAQRANPSQPLPEPVFDADELTAKLKRGNAKLAELDLPLLERLMYERQAEHLQRAIDHQSAVAVLAYEHLYPLRVEAALYQQYGGKVVARQISLQAAGAYQKLVAAAEASGKLQFQDGALERAFRQRLADDLAHREVPPEQVDFSLPVWAQVAAVDPASAERAASLDDTPASNPADDGGLLQRFSGVWRTTCRTEPAKWSPEGADFTVQEVTKPVLKGRYILAHEHSQPDGGKSLWLMTHDADRNVYPFWMFNSTGLLGGEWELTWDAATNTAIGHATDTPADWTTGGTNHFPDSDTNVVDYWMKDETGALLLEAHAEKHRQPVAEDAAILAAWSKSEPTADRPAELDQLEPMIGTWDAETVMHPAVWTPQEQRVTSVVTREWVLNQRFLLDRSIHSDGQESLSLFGYDPQAKEFRGWWFNSEGHRNTSKGAWSSDGQTFTSRADLEDGKIVRGTLRRLAPGREEWQFLITDGSGTVYFSSTIQTTRRAEGRE